MTSDGVHDVLSPLDIAAVLTQAATAHGAVRELVEAGKNARVVPTTQRRGGRRVPGAGRPAVARDNVRELARHGETPMIGGDIVDRRYRRPTTARCAGGMGKVYKARRRGG